MLTEEEARTKWCPHARQDDNVGIFRNALHDDNGFACIASECMAWRWRVEVEYPTAYHNLYSVGGGVMEKPKRTQLKTGYCGLAGRPE